MSSDDGSMMSVPPQSYPPPDNLERLQKVPAHISASPAITELGQNVCVSVTVCNAANANTNNLCISNVFGRLAL